MILAVIVLFCVAFVLGLWLVVLGVRYCRGSLFLAMGHVIFALSGLGLLGWEVFSDSVHKLYNISLLLFIFALSGGLILLAIRITKRSYRTAAPMFMVVLHAVMAVIALLLLVVGYAKY